VKSSERIRQICGVNWLKDFVSLVPTASKPSHFSLRKAGGNSFLQTLINAGRDTEEM